jgi:N-carbamoyl-L-amino-acid hydrolase
MSPPDHALPNRLSVPTDGERVWRNHMIMAKLGATPKGGVCRLALTPLDIEAHCLLARWAEARGFTYDLDAVGNMFIRRAGSEPDLPPISSGSHTDTQITGGRFDGIFGVLAAFEALEAIDDAGIVTRHPLEAVVWNNEEGSRFYPGCMGSAAYAGVLGLDRVLDTTDRDGIPLRREVAALRAALPGAGTRALGAPIGALIEAHIEQGPILEAEGKTIGIVTGMQGNRRFQVEVLGEEAHAGGSQRRYRKDALVDAVAMVTALHGVFHDPEDIIRFTIGRFEVSPGGLAVVPGRVFFTIDFRHPEQSTLDRLGDQVEGLCRAAAKSCAVQVTEISRSAPVAFTGAVPDGIARAAAAHGYAYREIYSGAGHDCRYFADHCPTGMIFIPCERGISHNEAENASPGDIAAATQVLADVMLELAQRR